MTMDIEKLRRLAMRPLVGEKAGLSKALSKIKFVQYDPIRKPLPAQDLILLQRVKNYKPGDLEAHYPKSKFEEDYLHVYGLLSKSFVSLLHPRPDRKKVGSVYTPKGLASDVLNFVRDQGMAVAKDVANVLGRVQITNDWGGKSSATTRALEELHYHGFIRVLKRNNGNKIYAPTDIVNHEHSPEERLRVLTLLIVELLSPVLEAGLRRAIGQLCAASGGLSGRNTVIKELVKAGKIESYAVEGMNYYVLVGTSLKEIENAENKVCFLAPFDPVVWDRDRFAHLWDWEYRFEAYIPPRRRRFGYYALPMFWQNRAIGWVNITKQKDNALDIDREFITKTKYGRDFERAYEHEVNRFESILSEYKK